MIKLMKRISDLATECEKSGFYDESQMLSQILAKVAIKTAQGSGYWSKGQNSDQESEDIMDSNGPLKEESEEVPGWLRAGWGSDNRGKEFYRAVNGKTFNFYGAHSNKFKLDDTVWVAVEDENDGYRSMLYTVEKTGDVGPGNPGGFFTSPIGTVKVVFGPAVDRTSKYSTDSIDEGFSLVDVNTDHVWLIAGTNNADDYYPMFVFNYIPDKNQSVGPGYGPKT